MRQILDILPILAWAFLWIIGGWLLTPAIFRLRKGETAMVGVGIGLVLETWLANLLAHCVPIAGASWLSAVLICASGVAAWRLSQPRVRPVIAWTACI